MTAAKMVLIYAAKLAASKLTEKCLVNMALVGTEAMTLSMEALAMGARRHRPGALRQ